MLEGLDAVEISISTCKSVIDFRIDANTYKKEFLRADSILKSHETKSIGEISKSIQNFGAYSLCNFINFQDSGIPFLMTKNVRENFIDWNLEKYVDKSSHEMLWKSHCHRGQVLVTMAGEYLGRVAVYDSDNEASSNQAIAKVTLKEDQSPYTISTFLNSKFGQYQIQRFKTITGQPNINMSLIESLRVPEFSSQLSQTIEDLMDKIDEAKTSSSITYSEAEQTLLEALGLKDFKPATQNTNTKTFAQSFVKTGRLDAEYYQPKYEDYIKLIYEYQNGWAKLSEVCTLKDTNYNPRDEKEYQYIELSDIDKSGGVTGCTKGVGSDLPSRARRLVNAGDLVVSSIEGSLSSCALVGKEYDRALCSTGFYVIKSSEINSETLLVLMRSELMQNILKQNCSGTILTAINKDEFTNIPIPKIDNNIQSNISQLVQQSFTLKAESKRLLEVAKRAIEIAIEQDEIAGIEYIELHQKLEKLK